MEQSIAKNSYSDLQKGIDVLVGKFGMPKTIQMIRQLSGLTNTDSPKEQRDELIYTFLITESKKVFRIPEGSEQKSRIEYKDARMACYHLLKHYTDMEYRAIGKHYGHGKFAVYYHLNKCKEALSIPKFHRSFVERYGILEVAVIDFITKL